MFISFIVIIIIGAIFILNVLIKNDPAFSNFYYMLISSYHNQRLKNWYKIMLV